MSATIAFKEALSLFCAASLALFCKADALKLKSSELDAVRDKIKESNNIGIELSEASIANTPDSKKITELQNRATKLQKELVTEMQALQTKAKTAP